MGRYAGITRLSPDTLRAIQQSSIPADAVHVDITGLNFDDAFDAFGNQFSQIPGAQVQVFGPPEWIDFSRLRHLDLHTQFSMILYQLSETFRREGGNVFRVSVDDPTAGVVTGTFILDADAEADLPLRGAWRTRARRCSIQRRRWAGWLMIEILFEAGTRCALNVVGRLRSALRDGKRPLGQRPEDRQQRI